MITTQYFKKIDILLKKHRLIFLIGPRRVGKTTLLKYLKKNNKDYAYFSADQLIQKNFANAQELVNFLRFEGIISERTKTILIDEAHYLGNISLILKNFFDMGEYQIVASGSGSLKIFADMQGELVGRKVNFYMYPLSFSDYLQFRLGRQLGLKMWNQAIAQSLQPEKQMFFDWGGYPEVVKAQAKKAKFRAQSKIFDSYLDEDVKYLLAKKDALAFEQMLPEMARSAGSLFVLDNIKRKVGISYTQTKKIKEILEHTLITKYIQPFATQKDEIKKHSKIYFIDTGMLRYVAQKFNINLGEKMEEFFVLLELLKHKPDYFDIKFWQRTNSTEVDFVLLNRINQELIPIEVKAGSTDNIPRAFDTFYQRYGSRVKRFYVANADVYKTRQYRDKEVIFIPHVLVSKVFGLEKFEQEG